jgi:hypothetical protein
MQNKVSILLVADDQRFLSQVEKAGQKGGDIASKGLINRLQATTASNLQSWRIPVSKSTGEAIGRDIGEDVTDSIPTMMAGTYGTNYKARGIKADERAKKKAEIAGKKKKESINNIKRNNRKDNLFGDEEFNELGPFAPLPVKRPASKKGTLKKALIEGFGLNIPSVKPISGKTPKVGVSGIDPFKIFSGEQDPRQDPTVQEILKQKAKSDRQAQQRREAEQKSKNKINSANQKIKQESLRKAGIETGDTNLKYEAKRQEINDRYNNKKNESLQTIDRLKFDRKQKVTLGGDTGAGVDYTGQIKGVQAVMAKNEELRQSELRILEVQKLQNNVVAKRKITDERVSNSRDRRDEELKSAASQRVAALETKKSSLTDKVSIAAVAQEISDVRSDFKKTKDINNINDALADLSRDSDRQKENQRLGINNPKLNAINFDQERESLINRRKAAESNYQQERVTGQEKFQAVINIQNEKSQQLVDKEARQLKTEDLKAKLAGATPQEKIKIQFQIDEAALNTKFDGIKEKLASTLTTLQQRQATLANSDIVEPSLNKLVADTEKLILQADKDKEAALKVLANQGLLKAALAKAVEDRQALATDAALLKPEIDINKGKSKDLIKRGRFLEAAIPGRAAAIDEENIRYNKQKSDFSYQVAKTRSSGVTLPQENINQAGDAIDRLHDINLDRITQQFNTLAQSISGSNAEFQKLARSETTDFITQLISGTKSFDDIWKKTLDNIIQGMIKILAQKFTDQLFDGSGKKGSNSGGVAGAFVSGIGALLGFANGGVIGQGRGLADDQLILTQRGEGVVTHKGMDILGAEGLAMLNKGYPKFAGGGVIGSKGSNGLNPGSLSSGLLNGNFNVDIKANGQSQPGASEQMSSKAMQAMRGVIAEEMRPGGILARFA